MAAVAINSTLMLAMAERRDRRLLRRNPGPFPLHRDIPNIRYRYGFPPPGSENSYHFYVLAGSRTATPSFQCKCLYLSRLDSACIVQICQEAEAGNRVLLVTSPIAPRFFPYLLEAVKCYFVPDYHRTFFDPLDLPNNLWYRSFRRKHGHDRRRTQASEEIDEMVEIDLD
jgi:hypothetical protein